MNIGLLQEHLEFKSVKWIERQYSVQTHVPTTP